MTPSASDATLSVAAELRSALHHAFVRHDRTTAVSVTIDTVSHGRIEPADLYTLVLAPLLTATGEAWREGHMAVWEEHYASAIVRTVVEAINPIVIEKAAEVARRDEVVLLACPSGEQHDLALRMLADRFTLAGYDAYYLGADTPVPEIVDAARTLGARLVVLSAATHFNRALLRQVVADLQEQLPGVRLGVGGPAFMRDCDGYAAVLLDPEEFGLPGAALPPGDAVYPPTDA